MTRKGMKRDKADREWSKAVRERDDYTCVRCETPYPTNSRGLHAAHIMGRGKLATRHDLINGVALCFGCHRWLDTHPDLKAEFFRAYLGDDVYDDLLLRSNRTKASA